MNLCIFGDSITWGAIDNEKGGWVERLKLHFMLNRDEVEIYNLGIPGEKTEDMLLHFEDEARARSASAIIFALGINDSQFIETKDNPRVPLDKFKENIISLITNAKKITSKIAYIGLTTVDESRTRPVPWAPTKNYDVESVRTYNEALEEICDKEGVLFVSVIDMLTVEDLDDGLHPGPAGHQKMFEVIKNTLEVRAFFK